MSLCFRCDMANTHQVSGALWLTRSSLPGCSMFSQAAIHFGIAYHVTSLCVNIFVILFIILQLLRIRGSVLANVPPTMPLVPLIAIFSISGFLHFVCSLLFIVTYVIGNPINQIFMCACPMFQACISSPPVSHISLMVHAKQTTEYLIILRHVFTPASDPAADLRGVVVNLSPLTSCASTPDNNPVVHQDFG